jgi:hypothetical protein
VCAGARARACLHNIYSFNNFFMINDRVMQIKQRFSNNIRICEKNSENDSHDIMKLDCYGEGNTEISNVL